MSKQITVYTTLNCPYCVMVKKYLNVKGLSFDEVDVELSPERRQEAIELSGAMTVPITVITKDDGSQSIAVGYNVSKLAAALV